MVSNRISTDNYGAGGGVTMLVNIYWGVKNLDTSKQNKWDPEYIGEVIWDSDFDLSPVQNQLNIINFCKELQTKDFVVE